MENQTPAATEVAPAITVIHAPGVPAAEKKVNAKKIAKAAKKVAKTFKTPKAGPKAVRKAAAKAAPALAKAEANKLVKAAVAAGKKITADVAAVVDLRKVPAEARRAPSSGQSGESRAAELTYDKLGADHKKILAKLNGDAAEARDDFSYDMLEIGEKGEKTDSGSRTSRLRVRNALRILIRDGWAEKKGKGKELTVRITAAGRARLSKAGK